MGEKEKIIFKKSLYIFKVYHSIKQSYYPALSSFDGLYYQFGTNHLHFYKATMMISCWLRFNTTDTQTFLLTLKNLFRYYIPLELFSVTPLFL